MGSSKRGSPPSAHAPRNSAAASSAWPTPSWHTTGPARPRASSIATPSWTSLTTSWRCWTACSRPRYTAVAVRGSSRGRTHTRHDRPTVPPPTTTTAATTPLRTLVGPQPSSAPLGRRAGHGRGPPAGKPVRNAAGRARGHHGTCIAGKRATQRASTKRTRAYVAWGGRRGPPRADDPHLRLPDRPPWVAAAGTSRSSMPKTSSGHSCGSRTSRTTRTSRGGPFSKKSSLPRSP